MTRILRDDDDEVYVPHGYAVTLDCMNQPKAWDVPGLIADMAVRAYLDGDGDAGDDQGGTSDCDS